MSKMICPDCGQDVPVTKEGLYSAFYRHYTSGRKVCSASGVVVTHPGEHHDQITVSQDPHLPQMPVKDFHAKIASGEVFR